MIEENLNEVKQRHDVDDEVAENASRLEISIKSHEKFPKYPSTHPRVVKERRDHERNDDDTQAIEPDEQKHGEVVGVLKDAETEEQHDRDERQEGDEDRVDDKPGRPKDRIPQADDLEALLDVLFLLADDEDEQVGDELRQGHDHVDGNDEAKGNEPVAGVCFLGKHLEEDCGQFEVSKLTR